ncbi:MAG: hypothetical protein AB2598_14980 [Candidatus Thiodiazotropha sp.]
MAISPSRRPTILLLCLAMLAAACSDDRPLSAEEQLRDLLNQAEIHLEARDLSSAMALVDPAYGDKEGRDFRALKAMLVGYFMRHKSVHILSKIDKIKLLPEAAAEVVVFAGLAGSPREVEEGLSQWRGDLLRVRLLFVAQSEGEWLLRTAEWRRATPQDLTL